MQLIIGLVLKPQKFWSQLKKKSFCFFGTRHRPWWLKERKHPARLTHKSPTCLKWAAVSTDTSSWSQTGKAASRPSRPPRQTGQAVSASTASQRAASRFQATTRDRRRRCCCYCWPWRARSRDRSPARPPTTTRGRRRRFRWTAWRSAIRRRCRATPGRCCRCRRWSPARASGSATFLPAATWRADSKTKPSCHKKIIFSRFQEFGDLHVTEKRTK